MAKKKTYTVKGHRQIQRDKEQLRRTVQDEYETKLTNLKKQIVDLFPELKHGQVLDALDAGLDVELYTKVSAQALMDILRS